MSNHSDEPCWLLAGVRCEKRNAGNAGFICKNCKKKFKQEVVSKGVSNDKR
jgi:transposase-like protein